MKCLAFVDDISENAVARFLRTVRRIDSPKLVLVNSDGGEVSFFPSYGYQLANLGITTIAGEVASAGNTLYLLGTERIAFVDSTFRFHEMHRERPFAWLWLAREYGIDVRFKDLPGINIGLYEDLERHRLKVHNWFMHFTSEQSGVPGSTLANLDSSNARLSAGEAREYGLVHTILENEALGSLDLIRC